MPKATQAQARRARAQEAPIEAPSLRLQAYEGFKQQLLDAALRPGEFVSQRKLAALMGLPLGAIREAIPRLEAEGLIKTVPQRGLQVTNVDLKLIHNAFQLRLILEKEAAARFTESISDAELDALKQAHESVITRAARGINQALLDEAQAVDWGLHDRMIDSLGNDIVSDIYRVNSVRIRLIRLDRVILTPDRLLPAMHEHLEIISALRTRKPAQTVAAVERHLNSARNRALGM